MIYKIVTIIIKMSFDSHAKLPPMTINKIIKKPKTKPNTSKTTKPKKITKCQLKGCKKKLSVVAMECRCQKRFCKLHFNAESHNCTFDYKQFLRQTLEDTIIGDKIKDRI